MNKLPALKDKDIIWKNDKPELYERFSQSIRKKQATQATQEITKEITSIPVATLTPIQAPVPANIPKVLNVIHVPANRLPPILANSPSQLADIQDIPRVADAKLLSIVNKATPNKEPKEPKVPKVPKEPKEELKRGAKAGTQKRANKDKNTPMKIIMEESLTYDAYRDDVRDKIIKFISTKEFNKVFGITKSAEIMSGIANDRFNKSTVLFISFLFDKCVIYNDKNIIYNKNNGVIEI